MSDTSAAREALARSAVDLAAATALSWTDALDLLARAAGWQQVGDGQVVVDRKDLAVQIEHDFSDVTPGWTNRLRAALDDQQPPAPDTAPAWAALRADVTP